MFTQVAHIGGSAPIRRRSARYARTQARTSSIDEMSGAIQRNHSLARRTWPRPKKRKCWWSLLNPGIVLPWMLARAFASKTGSGSAPGSSARVAAQRGDQMSFGSFRACRLVENVTVNLPSSSFGARDLMV
jgi:hypothetical protein